MRDGLGSMATEILTGLFAPDFHNNANFMMRRNMLLRTTQKDYARCSAALLLFAILMCELAPLA